MPETIKEQITADIIEVVGSIDQLLGYNNDVTAEDMSPRGSSRTDRKITVIDLGDTPSTDPPVNKDEYFAQYNLICRALTSDAQDGSAPDLSTEESRLIADVRKALMVDYTRGANAINTTIGTDSPVATEDGGRSLDVRVHYRTAKDDPYSI